jgi:hypothetical protein
MGVMKGYDGKSDGTARYLHDRHRALQLEADGFRASQHGYRGRSEKFRKQHTGGSLLREDASSFAKATADETKARLPAPLRVESTLQGCYEMAIRGLFFCGASA